MRSKTLIAVALYLVVVGSAVFAIAEGFCRDAKIPGLTAEESVARNTNGMGTQADPEMSLNGPSHKVVAYYFHGRVRCSTCRKIEAYTREALQTGFVEALRDGRLEWHVVNVEEDGNKHFIKDFELYTKSVVIVDTRNGEQLRWKNLKKVWELIYDKDAFLKYIRDEVSSYLGKD